MMMKLTVALFIVPVLIGVGACTWQWYLLHQFYPNGHIPYGHFRDAGARVERQAIVEGPSTKTCAVFITYAAAGSVIWFRRAARWRILLLLLWTFMAYLPFGIYNFMLAAQGDASVFI